jgi:hypothetical protein
VHVNGGQRRAQTTPPGTLQGPDVVDPAIAVEIERHRRRHVLAVDARDQEVEPGLIGTAEEPRRHLCDAQVLEPVR